MRDDLQDDPGVPCRRGADLERLGRGSVIAFHEMGKARRQGRVCRVIGLPRFGGQRLPLGCQIEGELELTPRGVCLGQANEAHQRCGADRASARQPVRAPCVRQPGREGIDSAREIAAIPVSLAQPERQRECCGHMAGPGGDAGPTLPHQDRLFKLADIGQPHGGEAVELGRTALVTQL